MKCGRKSVLAFIGFDVNSAFQNRHIHRKIFEIAIGFIMPYLRIHENMSGILIS